jgi:hypothetical protein
MEAKSVEWHIETKPPIAVQRLLRRKFNSNSPSKNAIKAWYEKCRTRGILHHRKGNVEKTVGRFRTQT